MYFSFEQLSVETVVLGRFRLDGGAMFGSVPKNLWSRAIAADAENCIPLATRSLLIRLGDKTILVDVGMGTKWKGRAAEIFAVQTTPLTELPFSATEITDIILTHLHFDHAGGISYFANEVLTPTYSQAHIYVQKANLENALAPTERESASYLPENVQTVRDGTTTLVAGATTLFDGISVDVVNGHTKGLQWVKITDSKQTLVFPSDLIPTAHHVPLPYIMGYDMCAETALDEKKCFLEQAYTENWIVVYQHDIETAVSRIGKDDRGRFMAIERSAD